MKNLQAYHVVITTHNSRTSPRMIKYRVPKGAPALLSLTQEVKLTEIIGEIITESGIMCTAFNICRDHAHLVIVCEPEELSGIMKIVKGKSSTFFNRWVRTRNSGRESVNGLKPIGREVVKAPLAHSTPLSYHPDRHNGHLWSQKFFFANMDVWKLATSSIYVGYSRRDSYLANTHIYIYNNRAKHQLTQSTELEQIIKSFLVDINTAFEISISY